MARDCCVALPRGAMGLSEVCDCGINFLIILTYYFFVLDLEKTNKHPKQLHRMQELNTDKSIK